MVQTVRRRILIVLLPLLILLIFTGIFVVIAPWRPKFPVESGTEAIAYTSSREVGRQIYLIRPDGTQETRLTYHIGRAVAWLPIPTYFGELVVNTNIQPAPVAGHLVYSSNKDGLQSLYQSALDGSDFIQLPSPVRENYSTKLSPNGQYIVNVANGELTIMDIEGTNKRCLTCTLTARADQPVWSPDGTMLAFAVVQKQGNSIYTSQADGTHMQRLTPPTLSSASPAWSPNGQQIAFKVSPNDSVSHIYVMSRDGSAIRQLTTFEPLPGKGAADYSPTWSPDSTRIAFISSRVWPPEIYTMNADGSDQRRITHSGKVSGPLVWLRVP